MPSDAKKKREQKKKEAAKRGKKQQPVSGATNGVDDAPQTNGTEANGGKYCKRNLHLLLLCFVFNYQQLL